MVRESLQQKMMRVRVGRMKENLRMDILKEKEK